MISCDDDDDDDDEPVSSHTQSTTTSLQIRAGKKRKKKNRKKSEEREDRRERKRGSFCCGNLEPWRSRVVYTQIDTLPQLVQLGGQADVTKLPVKAPRTCVPHKTSDPPSRWTAICKTKRARRSSHPLTSASNSWDTLLRHLRDTFFSSFTFSTSTSSRTVTSFSYDSNNLDWFSFIYQMIIVPCATSSLDHLRVFLHGATATAGCCCRCWVWPPAAALDCVCCDLVCLRL